MWRVVDISEPERHLSMDRGNLIVSTQNKEIGRVSIRDIQSVIVHGHGTTLSLNLSASLARSGIPLVLADRNHNPISLTLPISGNYEQAKRLTAQAEATRPLQKRIWQAIVKRKILAQAEAMDTAGHPDGINLSKMKDRVRSGDPENVEAQAARYYWPRLMGSEFRRDSEGGGLNSALNYGYAILRASVARAVVATGLAPGLGIHHRSRLNSFQLVDDLMEPFRPFVDLKVWRHRNDWKDGLDKDAKAVLSSMVTAAVKGEDGVTPLYRALNQVALSLADVFLGERQKIWFPISILEQSQEAFDFEGGN